MKVKTFLFTVTLLAFCVSVTAQASSGYKVEHKNAIVLAMFGTTVEPALKSLLNIRSKIEATYPGTPVRMAFTSNIIRKKWHHRAQDPAYVKAHPEIPDDVLHVKTPLATIANLQDEGFDTIVLQPTHVSMGEEFLDLKTYVKGLMDMGTLKKPKYKPFHKIALGRPVLGTHGTRHPYTEDIEAAAKAMAADVARARELQAGIVYMGHGNEFFPGSGGSLMELAAVMRSAYPDTVTVIGTVEGFPGIEEVMKTLRLHGVKKVLLKPFMIVAGDHALNDMAGDEEDSWKSVLTKNGFEVIPVAEGLGENDMIADILVGHLTDAAADAGITLQ